MMKKTTMMLAVLAAVLMICVGSAGATELWWWEVKVSGKGVQVATDNATPEGVVFDEGKDKVSETIYVLQKAATLQSCAAYQVDAGWEAGYVQTYGGWYHTDQNSSVMPWWCPQIGPDIDGNAGCYFCSVTRIQVKKNKAGDVARGRLTTRGGLYQCWPPESTSPFEAQFGGVKVRGKLVDENKVPEGARTALNDAMFPTR